VPSYLIPFKWRLENETESPRIIAGHWCGIVYKWNCASIFGDAFSFDAEPVSWPLKQSWNADLGICCIKFFIINLEGAESLIVRWLNLNWVWNCTVHRININELPVPDIIYGFRGYIFWLHCLLHWTYMKCYDSYIFHLSRYSCPVLFLTDEF